MEVFENLNWLVTDWNSVLITVFSTVLIYISIVLLTRINGLRTFAKMNSFDFAITITIGSVIGSTIILDDQPVAKGALILMVLIALQTITAIARKKSKTFDKVIISTPVLLMDGSTILEKNMEATRVSHSDLNAKLREANITDRKQVIAVVLETTGDISVLHTGDPGKAVSTEIMKDVVSDVRGKYTHA